MDQEKANRVLAAAQKAAVEVSAWADFANRLFNQHTGIMGKEFPMEAERHEFCDSSQYKEIRRLFIEVVNRTGTIEGANPREPVERPHVTEYAELTGDEGITIYRLHYQGGPRDGTIVNSIRPYDCTKEHDGSIYKATSRGKSCLEWVDDWTWNIVLIFDPVATANPSDDWAHWEES